MPFTPMTPEELEADRLETAIIIAAGRGLPCPVQTPEALARYRELCDDVAWLKEHGITLTLPDEHAPEPTAN